MTHTKGPWKVGYADWYYIEPEIVDQITNNKNSEANAYLIAAAPELLEACTVAYEHLAELPMPSEDQEYIYNKLEDAINKAEGR